MIEITTNTGATLTLPTGLVPRTHRAFGPNPYGATCEDCRAWCQAGEQIHHSSSCDTADLQASGTTTTTTEARPDVVRAARDGNAYAVGYDDEDLLLAVACGTLSGSGAMNQDF